jgi:Na+-transporting NADH:ubiquinone oxidoreductase subunit C
MTCSVALILAAMATVLKPIHKQNEALYNKRSILQAVNTKLPKPVNELTDEQVAQQFDNNIEQYVINMTGKEVDKETVVEAGYPGGKAENIELEKEKKKSDEERLLPLFVYQDDDEKYYIMSVRGSGLWDAIWGHIAFEDDFNTIAGATFDHKAETPGLGAEIKDNPRFRRQFKGKEIFNDVGEFVSVVVKKGGAKDPVHEVDGISGATITGDGVTDMLDRGISAYLPYINEKQEQDNSEIQ